MDLPLPTGLPGRQGITEGAVGDNIYRRNVEAFGHQLDQGLERPPIRLPEYTTLVPGLLSTTRHIGALDGSDQQLFAHIANPQFGVGIWATLYCEIDARHPDQETYRDGPVSAGAWSEDELLDYHLTMTLPNREVTRQWQNDLFAVRQVLSHTRPTDPPLFSATSGQPNVRGEAARERATGEWLALQAAVTHQLAPGDLLLRDGRFGCQVEMAAHWVDALGRRAARNRVRAVAVVKSGLLYQLVYPAVEAIAARTERPFYFVVPAGMIEEAYANEKQPLRKTLMLGGRDNYDLAGIGALWTVFCPDPHDFRTFVIIEFNLYDLWRYRDLARTPETLREWHARLLRQDGFIDRPPQSHGAHIHVTDLLMHPEHDLVELVEPTLKEILWLCEQELAHFGYPNLLGIAHRDVVLTKRKVEHLRRRYREILADSDRILRELVDQDFLEMPHKSHNIN